jgi:hypothetical protein
MTNEKINVAIAEACGWEDIAEPVAPAEFQRRATGMLRDKHGNRTFTHQIPDYSNDLNAMHEAERVFNYEQCEAFSNNVADIVHAANREKNYPFPWHFARIHAKARQRAEAFLRTLDKWKSEN